VHPPSTGGGRGPNVTTDSDQADPRHPAKLRLSLLPSGPDEVHASPLRGTRSSTSIIPPASAHAGLGREFSPAGADCRYRAPLVPRLARHGRFYAKGEGRPCGGHAEAGCVARMPGRAHRFARRAHHFGRTSVQQQSAPCRRDAGRRCLDETHRLGPLRLSGRTNAHRTQTTRSGGGQTPAEGWRRGWDSNPRWVAPYGISSAAP
jgi:hypothetical protein